MYQTQNYYYNKKIILEISDEILSYSYPNQNYKSIANLTLEHNLLILNNEFNSFLQKLLEISEESIYVLIAHSDKKGDRYGFYDKKESKTKIDLEDYLNKKQIELNFNSAILFICNYGFELKPKKFPILYPLGEFGNYSSKKNLNLKLLN